MRNFLKTILISTLWLCVFMSDAGAQGKIITKKLRISDVTVKTTKVVLSGNEMFDLNFMSEISRRWSISPFEFCSQDEYLQLKSKTDYYFLVPVLNMRKKEEAPGIAMLCFERGGLEQSDDPEKEYIEVISVPYAPAEESTGREFIFLPAVIDLIQRYTQEALIHDFVGYSGLTGYVSKQKKNWEKEIFIAETDLATTETQGSLINFLEADEVDAKFADSTPGALVGYVIAPTNPTKGSVCYKMLFSADTHELYYFTRHKLTDANGAGFLKSDIRLINTLKK